VKGISETITQPSLINLDYDMTAIMNQGRRRGHVSRRDPGQEQDSRSGQKDAMNHPLLDVVITAAPAAAWSTSLVARTSR